MSTLINDPFLGRAVTDIINERMRAEAIHPNYPADPVRRAALIAEESGETIQAALDMTRGADHSHHDLPNARKRLREEATHCAALCLQLMLTMDREDREANVGPY